MSIPAGYISRSDHAPAIRILWQSTDARREWRIVCREEGISPTDPAYCDPTADGLKRQVFEPLPPSQCLCEFCSKPFVRTRPTARFCSPQCRFAASKLRKKGAGL